MLLAEPVVVVSPLLALLEDQSRRLKARGVPVVRLDSTVRGAERRASLARARRGGPLLIMTTPETLASKELGAVLDRTGIGMVAIDEAHCASEWGHDFRPAYLRLAEVLRGFGSPPVMALTATATAKVRADLIRFLALKKPLVIAESPHRPNLAFEVISCGGNARLRALSRLVLNLPRPGIVYCSTTRDVDAVHGALRGLGIAARRYHGRMNGSARRTEQEHFMSPGGQNVMVATSAFGLGIDKPDIRYIVHFQAPASLEQYVQEAGRAGRDGERAACVMLYDPADRSIHEFLLDQSRIRPPQLAKIASTLAAWKGDRRAPSLAELATTAGLPRRIAAALVAVLEEAGLVTLTRDQRVRTPSTAAELRAAARRIAIQYESLRRHDGVRLDAVADYATAPRCRAQLLRAYFGVPTGRRCGACDVCHGRTERPRSFFAPLERPGRKKPSKRRRRKRRRGRRGRRSPRPRAA